MLSLILTVLLTVANIALEAYKWFILARSIHPTFSWQDGVRGTLLGLSAAIITPGRLGEYLGRLWNIPKDLRAPGLFLVFITRLAQLSVTIWGVLILYNSNRVPKELLFIFEIIPEWLLLAIGVFIAVLYSAIVLRPDFFTKVIGYLTQKYRDFIYLIVVIPKRFFLINFWASCLRYIVFLLQYWLLFDDTGDVSLLDLSTCVSLVFFIKSIIPSIAVAELGVRGSIALWVLAPTGISVGSILSVTALIYLINQVFPAIAGWFIGVRIKKTEHSK